VWKALDVEMQTEARSTSAYDFKLGTDPRGAAQLTAKGAFDLDDLWVQADQFHLALAAGNDDAERSALPAQVQALLARYEIKGKARLSCGGKLGLKPADGGLDIDGMTLDAQTEGMTVQLPWFQAPFTALRCTGAKTAGSRVILLTDGTCSYDKDRVALTRARL